MDKIRFSKTDSRRTVMALAIVAMFVATLGVGNVDAAASDISITADKSSATIMEDSFVVITLTLGNSDTRYVNQEVYMIANWPGGTAWTHYFFDVNGNELPSNLIVLDKATGGTVQLQIYCTGDCKAGDTNSVQVYAKTDPMWYSGSTRTATNDDGEQKCGSSDCTKDTTAASASGNVTNKLTISLAAATEYSSSVTCDTTSSTGTNTVYQDVPVQWGYSLTNTGYASDSYQFAVTVDSDLGAETGFWTVTAGLQDGHPLIGTSESVGSKTAEAEISITPASNARPGPYTITLNVLSKGPDSGCSFKVNVPEPDLEIKNADISFSHTSSYFNTQDNAQVVTIYANVRNNGGSVDPSGTTTTDVVVKFYVDGAQTGEPKVISSLAFGEEKTISIDWKPGRAYKDDTETGIPVKVVVDPSDVISESDKDNNEGEQAFKVLSPPETQHSFLTGFLGLISAIAVSVMLSSYYRNKDSEE